MAKEKEQSEVGIAVFQRTEVRRTLHNSEWWFVITDVVASLNGRDHFLRQH